MIVNVVSAAVDLLFTLLFIVKVFQGWNLSVGAG